VKQVSDVVIVNQRQAIRNFQRGHNKIGSSHQKTRFGVKKVVLDIRIKVAEVKVVENSMKPVVVNDDDKKKKIVKTFDFTNILNDISKEL
jgi:hypothetical protein